jgi:hypothetical protein
MEVQSKGVKLRRFQLARRHHVVKHEQHSALNVRLVALPPFAQLLDAYVVLTDLLLPGDDGFQI